MRYLILILAIFFSGCGFKELKPLSYYSIKEPTSLPKVNRYPNATLKMDYPLALNRSLDYKMAFEYDNGKSGYYQNSQWLTPLNRMIRSNIITTLNRAKVFKSVVPMESSVFENYRLEVTINNFKNVIENNTSYALIDINVSLIDMDNRSIVKRKNFRYKVMANTLNAKGYAEAVNRAFAKFDRDLVEWLGR